MRSLIVVSCVLLLASAAAARSLTGAKPATAAAATAPHYASVAAALNNTRELSTLLAAVTAAGISIPADKKWTILAPNNEAFVDILEDLNITAAELLMPKNKPLLTRILQYHVIPGGAMLSSQLKDNETLTTALAGAAPLRVHIKTNNGTKHVTFMGASNSAKAITTGVKAGSSVVIILNDVLLPAGVKHADDADEKEAEKGVKKMKKEKASAGAGGAAPHMSSAGSASKQHPPATKKP